MRRVLFVFLDGVGLGPAAEYNPFAENALPAFEALAGGQRWTGEAKALQTESHVFRPIDARLGIEGLPQSGTGQATLFTGVNCAEIVGRHFGPFPHSETHPVIARRNVFKQVLEEDRTAAFANAYPPIFFKAARRRKRWTVTTLAATKAGLPIRGIDALQKGEAITADITGRAWREKLNLNIPLRTETEAAQRLHEIHRRHDFTLFEYYLTDKAGHGRLDDQAAILQALDSFFEALLEYLDTEESLLVITSDHGNLEDLSVKTHTLNPVPLLAYGAGAHHFAEIEDLTGVTPAIVTALKG